MLALLAVLVPSLATPALASRPAEAAGVARDDLGTTVTLHLASAPFPDGRSRYTDDTVIAFVADPDGYKIELIQRESSAGWS